MSEKWTHKFAADALNAENDDTKTANRFGLEWQSDYKLTEVSYTFGNLRYADDDFGPFSETVALTGGYGRKQQDTHKFCLWVS